MLSGSSVEPDNTNVKSSHQHKGFWHQVEILLTRVRERPFTPFLEGVSERSERGVWTQCVGQVAHFNLTPENLFMLMV